MVLCSVVESIENIIFTIKNTWRVGFSSDVRFSMWMNVVAVLAECSWIHAFLSEFAVKPIRVHFCSGVGSFFSLSLFLSFSLCPPFFSFSLPFFLSIFFSSAVLFQFVSLHSVDYSSEKKKKSELTNNSSSLK